MLDWAELEEANLNLGALYRDARDSTRDHNSVQEQIAMEEARREQVIDRLFRRLIDQAAA